MDTPAKCNRCDKATLNFCGMCLRPICGACSYLIKSKGWTGYGCKTRVICKRDCTPAVKVRPADYEKLVERAS